MNDNNFYDSTKPYIIAIDGMAASGKGTIASIIAKRFSFIHCQTSIFYRSLAFRVVREGIREDDNKSIIECSKSFDVIDSNEIYTDHITRMSSIVASIPEVRQNLYHSQRDFILNNKRVVMEGRDIGTVIAPDADLKIYITADLKTRSERRVAQMLKNGLIVTLDEVIASLKERDERDQNRIFAPLTIPKDALFIDSSNMTVENVIDTILTHYNK